MNDSIAAMSYQEASGCLDVAIELARSGETSKATAAVPMALAAFPDDVNVVHKAGVIYYFSQQWDQALACFHQALKIWPEFPYTLLELGNLHSDLGQLEQASDWYRRAAQADPSNILAHLRGARTEQALGRAPVAVELLSAGQQFDPSGFEINLELARALVFQNRRNEAIGHYARAVAARPADETVRLEYLDTLNETGRYARLLADDEEGPTSGSQRFMYLRASLRSHAKLALHFDRCAVLHSASTREQSAGMRSPADALALIRRAIAARSPLSLTRHGDGEGRFLVMTGAPADVGLSAESAAAIGDTIWWNWFGESLAHADHAAIRDLRKEFDAAIAASDILGLPLASRLELDFRHFGYLAVLEERVSGIIRDAPHMLFTDSLVNVALHRLSRFYQDLLAGLPFIGVIGPHEELAARLAIHLGIRTHRTYTVPGEMRLPDQQERGEAERHFPRLFRQLMTGIEVPYRGAVFLVAAGLLGKVYCNRIKSLGGIGLDIGSIADAWLGYNTRPGQYDDVAAWRLPA